MILIYVTCDSVKQARKIGKYLLKRRLCSCINIYPQMIPMLLWPPKSGLIDESKEVVLIIKTLPNKYKQIEEEVLKIQEFDTPCIFSIPVINITSKYFNWIKSEIKP